MTEETPAFNPMDIQVETNSAPTEQRSVEMVTTEPQMSLDEVPETPAETAEPTEPSSTADANETARKAIEAELRAENAERQLRDLQPQGKKFDKEPDINDYETLEAWKADLKDFHKQEYEGEFNRNQTAKQQQEVATKLRADVQAKALASRAKHADFDQFVKPLAPIMDSIPILADFISKNPMGTEVAYELAKQPALLEQIRNNDLWAAGEMLINMAARLKKPAAVQVSNAPDPIKTVGNRETVKTKLSQLDTNTYIAKMNKMELDAKRRAN